MKLQCSCGAKYAFDATPEMLQHPVKFICPSCGLDSSDFVNELIRQEFGGQIPPPPRRRPSPPPPRHADRARRNSSGTTSGGTPSASKFCAEASRERATEKCAVCQKPICPKCLELFGYFCSPLCKGKAEAQNLDVPVYAGRKDLVEARFWRKTGLMIGVIGAVIVLAAGRVDVVCVVWFRAAPLFFRAV